MRKSILGVLIVLFTASLMSGLTWGQQAPAGPGLEYGYRLDPPNPSGQYAYTYGVCGIGVYDSPNGIYGCLTDSHPMGWDALWNYICNPVEAGYGITFLGQRYVDSPPRGAGKYSTYHCVDATHGAANTDPCIEGILYEEYAEMPAGQPSYCIRVAVVGQQAELTPPSSRRCIPSI